ncbi:MAG: hypothetical protein AAF125_20115, partial [Chloroflexota bacterium]
MQITTYHSINESHRATGFPHTTNLPGFDVFRIEDTYPHTRRVMPPYRFNFYQMVLFVEAVDASLT